MRRNKIAFKANQLPVEETGRQTVFIVYTDTPESPRSVCRGFYLPNYGFIFSSYYGQISQKSHFKNQKREHYLYQFNNFINLNIKICMTLKAVF